MSDDFGDGVQPEEGQGGGTDQQAAPYAEYLQRIPEETRGQVEPVFRDWDANTTRRFQEAAEYRKQWEPYEQAGIRDVPADELQGWMQFRQAAQQNPQAIADWYAQYAQHHGLEAAQQQMEQQGFSDPDMEAMLDSRLQQTVGPIAQQLQQMQQYFAAQEQQRLEAIELDRIEGQLKELEKEPGFDRGLVEKFIMNHVERDPDNAVTLAWQDAKQLLQHIEQQVLKDKLSGPKSAEAGGGTAGDEPIRDLKLAGQMAREQLREMNRANS